MGDLDLRDIRRPFGGTCGKFCDGHLPSSSSSEADRPLNPASTNERPCKPATRRIAVPASLRRPVSQRRNTQAQDMACSLLARLHGAAAGARDRTTRTGLVTSRRLGAPEVKAELCVYDLTLGLVSRV